MQVHDASNFYIESIYLSIYYVYHRFSKIFSGNDTTFLEKRRIFLEPFLGTVAGGWGA